MFSFVSAREWVLSPGRNSQQSHKAVCLDRIDKRCSARLPRRDRGKMKYWLVVASVLVIGGGYLGWRYASFDWPEPQARREPKQSVEQVQVLLDPNTIVTRAGSVLCVSSLSFEEAFKADKANDLKWLNSVGCVRGEKGIPVVVISTTDFSGNSSLLWQVRLRPEGSEGITVGAHVRL